MPQMPPGVVSSGYYLAPPVNFTQLTNTGFFDGSSSTVYLTDVAEMNGNACVLTFNPSRIHWRNDTTSNWSSFEFDTIGYSYCMVYFNSKYLYGGSSGIRSSSTINSNGSSVLSNYNVYEFIIAGSNLFAIGKTSGGTACILKSTDATNWSQVYVDGTEQYNCVTKQQSGSDWILWIGTASGNIRKFNTTNNSMLANYDIWADNINVNQAVEDIIYVPAWDMIVANAGGYLWASPTGTWWQSMARGNVPFVSPYDYDYQYFTQIDSGKGGSKTFALDTDGKLMVVGNTGSGTFALFQRSAAPTLREIYLGTYYGNQWSPSLVTTNAPNKSWYTQDNRHHVDYFPTLGWLFIGPGTQAGTTSKGFAYATNTVV